MKNLLKVKRKNRLARLQAEEGFTLLEYCAGATVIAITVYGALTVLGNNFQNYLDSLGTWLTDRGAAIEGSA